MKAKPIFIPIEDFKRLLSYDKDSGVFTWIAKSGRGATKVKVGNQAGCLMADGYRAIYIFGRMHKEHRLAWAFVYGEWPPENLCVDHINRIRNDNRIENLRCVTRSQNCWNVTSQNGSSSKFLGVTLNKKSNRWEAKIKRDRKAYYLGSFLCENEARDAYQCAKEKLHLFAAA